MKKIIPLLLIGLFTASANATIPYCTGTHVEGSKHDALQYVVKTFASENNCVVGTNCILNFDSVKYSIAWDKDCSDSANKGNNPKGSTFVCSNGECHPLGFQSPNASY